MVGACKNQDHYAYGWAFVLDGASSIDSPTSGHDGGWYAERLKNALTNRLRDIPIRSTVDVVADAITEAASAHDRHEGACPTSTIALARWNANQIELYILGDSYVIISTDDGPLLMTDDRLATVAPDLRTRYRQRLAQGRGFDAIHRQLLRELQQHEARHRNLDGGYWIAGDNPDSARHAIIRRLPRKQVFALALLSDGVLAAGKDIWLDIMAIRPCEIIGEAMLREQEDRQAIDHPRSKAHDDKTVVLVRFGW